jgi:hypothetical protein
MAEDMRLAIEDRLRRLEVEPVEVPPLERFKRNRRLRTALPAGIAMSLIGLGLWALVPGTERAEKLTPAEELTPAVTDSRCGPMNHGTVTNGRADPKAAPEFVWVANKAGERVGCARVADIRGPRPTFEGPIPPPGYGEEPVEVYSFDLKRLVGHVYGNGVGFVPLGDTPGPGMESSVTTSRP